MADEKDMREQNTENESVAARRIRALNLDRDDGKEIAAVEHVGFWENFWYHHKWKTIISLGIVFLVLISTLQMCTQNAYDVYLVYAGPGYLTQNEVRSAQDGLKQIMDDYNRDGKRSPVLNMYHYLNDEQIADAKEQAEAEGIDFTFDYAGNKTTLEQFQMGLAAGEAVICLLDPELFESVKRADGLLPLAEVLPEIPAGAIDEYGIRLSETDFAEIFSTFGLLPEDTVLCIRRISAISVFKGKKSVEEMHARHVDLFCKMVALKAADTAETSAPTPTE